jgi:hypothetical protein
MYTALYNTFLSGDDTLRLYRDDILVFSSIKDRLLPLMEYLADNSPSEQPVTIFDKVMGNAAALLAVKANCGEVFSPLGSELAIKTLEQFGIVYHLDKAVPYIVRDDGKGMCPMEQLSIGKEPDEFYEIMKAKIKESK